MMMMRKAFLIATLVLLTLGFVPAFATPVTYNVTPTFSAPSTGGAVSGYRAYSGCNQTAQTASTLIGPATSGTQFSFAGDTTSPPVVCIRAWNASGEGGFNAITLNTPAAPPGSVTATMSCTVSSTQFACVAQ